MLGNDASYNTFTVVEFICNKLNFQFHKEILVKCLGVTDVLQIREDFCNGSLTIRCRVARSFGVHKIFKGLFNVNTGETR